jgi:opacity protein-like surface antigen
MTRYFIILLLAGLMAKAGGFEGYYIGGSAGAVVAEAHQKGTIINTVVGGSFATNNAPLSINAPLLDHSWRGSMFTGFAKNWGSFFLGFEGYLQFSRIFFRGTAQNFGFADSVGDTLISTTKTKAYLNTIQYGIDLRPGLLLNPITLLYGRIGLGMATMKLSTKNNFQAASSGESLLLPLNLSKRRTQASVRAGGGIEYALTPKLALRTDYIYTDYGRVSVSGTNNFLDDLGALITINADNRIHVTDHTVLLGLNYYFCPSCQSLSSCVPAYCGFYIAGAVGGNFSEVKQKGEATLNFPTFIDITSMSAPSRYLSDKSFEGIAYLGYGKPWKKVYLGAEFFVEAAKRRLHRASQSGFSNDLGNSLNISFNSSIKNPWQYGIDLRPGILLAQRTLLYGRVGTAFSDIQVRTRTEAITAGRSFGEAMTTITRSKDVMRAAFRLGVGVEQQLISKIHVRCDYAYTHYGSIKLSNSSSGVTTADLPITINNSLKVHPKNHSVTLGLAYYFSRGATL